ncbi:MAG: heterodisulfide reductase-related iron-sulfur binding cluster [Gemmatimonadetes bacterium]|nr:heterodisulfide reductase-related iron-sulfur binding cluster [Gemmatimonadota bacterium]MDA1102166.1 heterodisulfide reductase-related iron-sulfur binding cluster [Gemmatimonadota bacterium]
MSTTTGSGSLASALEAQRERLLPCVHCGFCLPACPTYNRLGDEADSPRGRLHLMQAVVDGRLDAGSDAFHTHIDRCLGCRACEPVCPSGVEYGTLLELARETATRARPQGKLTRALLAVMGSPALRAVFFLGGRTLRSLGVARLAVRLIPAGARLGGIRLAFAMLASSSPPGRRLQKAPVNAVPSRAIGAVAVADDDSVGPVPRGSRGRVAYLEGCVQRGLFERINQATVRTLEANGYEVVPVAHQGCCGALHAHGGDLRNARRLAGANILVFEGVEIDYVAVNAAGCGAAMKDYGTLFESNQEMSTRAEAFAAKVRDVTELLSQAGPRRGAPVSCSVAYDHPCHLLHAQGVAQEPLDVLRAVPGIDVRLIDRADECCGGAGIYGITHPELGGRIGRDKVAAILREEADHACTPNPGCMMQIGAGLLLEGSSDVAVHPIELLDESYRRAGYYSATGDSQ